MEYILFLIIGLVLVAVIIWLLRKFIIESNKLSAAETRFENANTDIEKTKKELLAEREELKAKTGEIQSLNKQVAQLDEKNKNITEKLETQKKEIETIGEKFSNEFKNLANEILEDKSKRFTELNQTRIKEILEPLGKNIDDFKKKVDETHKKDIEDRASIQEKIKNLVESSNKISAEATNLTKALKGSSKKQGNWGEMILENILEVSGLVKGREYFVQEFLKDESGNLIKDETGRKLQPDVIIKYPDERKVIIDSKVSLVDYDRYVSTDDFDEQKKQLENHIMAIHNHINSLSSKNYQNYAPALDFVMLFFPIEPAYLLAIQNDPDLWNFAYKKRILLISPTNLIAALKLVADLWKREYQNRYAIEIAERGGKLYDKFVNFVDSLSDIGDHIEKTQKSYDDAMKQLKTGSGNLIGQVEKLKDLGVKATKAIPQKIIDETNETEN